MDMIKQFLSTLFGGTWELFSALEVPGFGVSLAKVAVGFFVVRFSLNLLSLVTGFRTNVGSGAESFRTSSESLHQYRAVRDQQLNREKLDGGIGFH